MEYNKWMLNEKYTMMHQCRIEVLSIEEGLIEGSTLCDDDGGQAGYTILLSNVWAAPSSASH